MREEIKVHISFLFFSIFHSLTVLTFISSMLNISLRGHIEPQVNIEQFRALAIINCSLSFSLLSLLVLLVPHVQKKTKRDVIGLRVISNHHDDDQHCSRSRSFVCLFVSFINHRVLKENIQLVCR